MNEEKERSNQTITISLLWGAMFISYVIRFAFGVVAPTLMQLYGISPKTMGYILSGWNWPYTAAQVFVGTLADRFGVWIVMGVGSGIWGLTTVAMPIASTAVSLFLMRAMFGLAQSMLTSSTAVSVSRFFGRKERARAIAVAYSGSQVGLAVGGTIAALILVRLGWQAVFYCLGSGSLLLTLAWVFSTRTSGSEDSRREQERGKKGAPASTPAYQNVLWALAGFHFSAIVLPGALLSARWGISTRSSSS